MQYVMSVKTKCYHKFPSSEHYEEVTQHYGAAGSVHFWTLILLKKIIFPLCRAHEIYCKSIKPIIIRNMKEGRN